MDEQQSVNITLRPHFETDIELLTKYCILNRRIKVFPMYREWEMFIYTQVGT